jgi:hypothetical protein
MKTLFEIVKFFGDLEKLFMRFLSLIALVVMIGLGLKAYKAIDDFKNKPADLLAPFTENVMSNSFESMPTTIDPFNVDESSITDLINGFFDGGSTNSLFEGTNDSGITRLE